MRRWDLSSKPEPFVPSKLDTCILEMATSKLPISTLSKYRYHCQGNILWFSHLRGQCSSWPCRGRSRPCTSSCQSLWSWPCECAKSRFPTSSGKVACPSRVASSVCDTKKSEKKIQRRRSWCSFLGKVIFYLRLRLGMNYANELDFNLSVSLVPILFDFNLGRVWKKNE